MKLKLTHKHFAFLDSYREHSNPFFAGTDLRYRFGINRNEANYILKSWMDTYSSSKSIADRLAEANNQEAK